MNEQEMERIFRLQEPEELEIQVKPWGTAMGRILWGLGLTTLTLNVLYLQYILPTVGLVLLLLGFRTLRRENAWMRAGWIVSLVRAGWHFFFMVDLALGLLPGQLSTWTSVGLSLLQTLCLWRGLMAVRTKAGQEASAPAGIWLLVWQVATILLGLAKIQGWIPVLLMVAFWIMILRSLNALSHTIDEAGYAVEAAPVRISAPVIRWGYLGCVAAAVALCLLLGGRYPMEWTPKEAAGNTVAALRLRNLGMPQEILNDLSPEDLALLADATAVRVGELAPGNMVDSETAEHEEEPLELQIVVAEMPAETGRRWIVLHRFRWKTDPDYRGMDCLAVGTNEYDSRIVVRDEAIAPAGRVLCERDGEIWTAPYHAVGQEQYTATSWFSSNFHSDVLADFSALRGGTELRGYLLYGLRSEEEELSIANTGNFHDYFYYYHQFRPSFPLVDARTHVQEYQGNTGAYRMGATMEFCTLLGVTR